MSRNLVLFTSNATDKQTFFFLSAGPKATPTDLLSPLASDLCLLLMAYPLLTHGGRRSKSVTSCWSPERTPMPVTADQTFLSHRWFRMADSFVCETNHPLSFQVTWGRGKRQEHERKWGCLLESLLFGKTLVFSFGLGVSGSPKDAFSPML